MNNRSAIKFAILFLFIIIGTYLIFHFNFHVIFMDKDKLVDFVESFHPFDEIVFMSLQILQVVFAPIPGEVTGFIGGYIYGPILGTLYSTIGLVIGSWLAFILARFLGLPFVEKTVKPEILKKYDFILEHKGALVAFILFLIPGFPKDFLCYIMGLSHMRLWTFLGCLQRRKVVWNDSAFCQRRLCSKWSIRDALYSARDEWHFRFGRLLVSGEMDRNAETKEAHWIMIQWEDDHSFL